jgi:hypothetical protein
MIDLNSNPFGHGVLRRNPLVKIVQKLLRQANGQKIGKSTIGFDWEKGFDVRDTIGPIQIKNQGQNSSCGGQAGAYFLEIQERLRGIKEGTLSAKSIYSPWRNIGGGMTVTQLNTQIGATGANLEATVPSYDINGNPLSELMMEDYSWHNDRLDTDALTRAGYTPYDIAEDIETVAQTIQNYGAVIMEVRGNNNGSWLSTTPTIQKVGEYWYHYLCICGARVVNNQKKLIALQSWGETANRGGVTYPIGDHGTQYFGNEWFTSKNIVDAFTWIHDSVVVPIPTPIAKQTIWQALALWFRQQWGLANSSA